MACTTVETNEPNAVRQGRSALMTHIDRSFGHSLAKAALLSGVVALTLTPQKALACACGCGVFEIGTASLLPSEPGVTTFLEYDYSDQNRNWSGTSSAPASGNSDKEIQTHFFTVGAQYMSEKGWGIMVEVPYWQRHFETDPGTGVISIDHGSIGDIRIQASYSGFFDDMSTGISVGLKLPTGDYKDQQFDRDTEIGTGSTDIILGAFHHGAFSDTSRRRSRRLSARQRTQCLGWPGLLRHRHWRRTETLAVAEDDRVGP
jgi:hypothetical protein